MHKPHTTNFHLSKFASLSLKLDFD